MMAKSGRPTRYNKNYHPLLIELLARLGYTEEETAKYLGVCKATITNWKKKHKEFLASLKKGRSQIVDKIEHALYKKALGYDYEEVTDEEVIIVKNGKEKKISGIKRKTYKKKMAPDATAIIFSLKNLAADKWRDKQEHEIKVEKLIVNRIKAEGKENT